MLVSSTILGIDPGSRFTGYGIIKATAQQRILVTCGVIKIKPLSMEARLWQIYEALDALVKEYQPEVAAIETAFMSKNASSALKLGQARGAAMVALSSNGLAVHEYSPRQVKLAVTGSGAADKVQVDKMVRLLLSVKASLPLQSDATDALAVAICYANSRRLR